MEFPTFDGKEDPLEWLNHCEQYFRGQRTIEEDKVWLASYHLKGAAHTWYFMVERDCATVTWPQFKELCNERFGPPLRTNPLGKLARLRFRTTVDDYQERFSSLLCHTSPLAPDQQVQLFTAGLPERIKIDVELMNPQNLQQASRLARAYERRSQVIDSAQQPQQTGRAPRPSGRPPVLTHMTDNAAKNTPQQPPTQSPVPFKRLTPAEMAERRKQGLCYNCDEPYVRGHRCPRLFYLEVTDFADDEIKGDTDDDQEEQDPVVSLHAITGIRREDTMQLRVVLNGQELLALLDTGSTHNFINCKAAQQCGVTLEPTPGRHVKVANGDPVFCQGVTRRAAIDINKEKFTIEAYAIPLDTFEIILGTAFLRTLGPVLWDLQDLCMAFWHEGRRILWKGLGSVRTDTTTPTTCSINTEPKHMMDHLLQSFDDVFEEPQSVPPARHCDHRIHLKPGTAPVAVRPYRYPQLQKDELEAQCADMLRRGIIRHSTSAFSAPVLLVKKPDNTWRFCIDYRALNEHTIKDKYPIPVVDELLDELHGARFYTKLDLRSGYHQVRMHKDDIEKTAFRTHHGHFEFLVMPFGLTNAPATFQSLMNSVLQPLLRRCVLVFFDDILIYSPSWSAHLQHVRAVMTLLRTNSLFVKKSKCSFGATSIVYLGHVISESGVSMDSDKVEAITAWPTPKSARGLRGFLGIAGYYRKFIKDFGTIAAPLTKLLKKDSFAWSAEAATTFTALKEALSTAPVLHLPEFTKSFIVDCDASGSGFGAVLHQDNDPIAFFSRPFATRHLKLAAYERELIGLV